MDSLFVRLGYFDQEPKAGSVHACPFHNETNGKSLSLDTKRNGWVANCFSPKCGFKGDEFAVIRHHFGLSTPQEAYAKGAELAGVTPTAPSFSVRPRAIRGRPEKAPNPFANLPAIPEAIASVWAEGVEHLRGGVNICL